MQFSLPSSPRDFRDRRRCLADRKHADACTTSQVGVEDEEFADIAELFPPEAEDAEEKAPRSKDSYVYLVQWGDVFKIRRGQDLEKRVKQFRAGLSDSRKLVHAIRRDDPPG